MDSGHRLEPDEDRDDLIALLGAGPAPLVPRSKKEFQPWHRPRKQYVRNRQWSRELGFLARDLGLAEKELRYLTLPGSDLLDIRHIVQTVCERSRISLKFLGFNSAASPFDAGQAALNSSQFSVNRLTYVHRDSEVYPGDFRMVGDYKSPQWQRVRRAGPFHAINIDLCGGFAGRDRQNIPSYFTALKALLRNQGSADEDFLLFITTRMDMASLDSETWEVLSSIAQNILDLCDDYSASFVEAWGLQEAGQDCLSNLVTPSEVFMLGLTQWVVEQGVEEGLKASVKSFMTYRTGSENGDDDIVSLAIRFKPDPHNRVDAYGLAQPVDGYPTAEERICQQSSVIPDRVSSRTLVDSVLREQAEEFQRCFQESTRLLVSAGYDESSYRSWVAQEKNRYAGAPS